MFEDFLSGRDAEQRTKANEAYLKTLAQRVDKINALEATIEELGDDELVAKTAEFKQRLAEKGEDLNGPLLEEAFAVVREAAWYVYTFANTQSYKATLHTFFSLILQLID